MTPDQLTAFGLLASAATAFAIGSGHLIWGVIGIAVSGLGDLLDGAVARRTGQVTARGAFFDSVADRVSDALLLGGVAWYLAPEPAPSRPRARRGRPLDGHLLRAGEGRVARPPGAAA